MIKSKKALRPVKRRLTNAYFISTLSITLVLFLIGLLGLMIVNVQYLNQYIRENIGLTLVLDEEVKEVELLQLQKVLSARPEVKSATYVNSETAALMLKEELGEDFLSFLGYNPINANSIPIIPIMTVWPCSKPFLWNLTMSEKFFISATWLA